MKTMTKYTPKALNDTAWGIGILNSEVKMLQQAICALIETYFPLVYRIYLVEKALSSSASSS
jgi:hypothetical protein